MYYFLFELWKIISALLFHLKGFKRPFEFVNWWMVNSWFRYFDVTNRLKFIIISYVPNQIRIHKSVQPFLNGKMTIVFCHFSQPNVKCSIDKLSILSIYAWGGVKVNGSLEVKKERCERDKFPDFLWQKIIVIPFFLTQAYFSIYMCLANLTSAAVFSTLSRSASF